MQLDNAQGHSLFFFFILFQFQQLPLYLISIFISQFIPRMILSFKTGFIKIPFGKIFFFTKLDFYTSYLYHPNLSDSRNSINYLKHSYFSNIIIIF